jgi:hypothetical protein
MGSCEALSSFSVLQRLRLWSFVYGSHGVHVTYTFVRKGEPMQLYSLEKGWRIYGPCIYWDRLTTLGFYSPFVEMSTVLFDWLPT